MERGGGCGADVSLLRGVVEDMRGPLHKVLSGDCRLDYPCCCWAAASLSARYLREAGFNAEVMPFVYVGGVGDEWSGNVKRLMAMPISEREPSNLKKAFGDGFFSELASNTHQAVGVRFHEGGCARLFMVDFLLPQLFGGRGCDRDYLLSEVDVDSLLGTYMLILVSPKFVKFPRVESRMFDVDLGSVSVDLSDQYTAFKKLVDRERRPS